MAKQKPRGYYGGAKSIQGLTVEGFKSIDAERSIEIRPLTILAGANSAGKSSQMQPLLLLKQTLEAPYDPGPLLLNGPNVEFTSVSQFLYKTRSGSEASAFSFGIDLADKLQCRLDFRKAAAAPLELERQVLAAAGRESTFKAGVTELSNSPLEKQLRPGLFDANETVYVRTTRIRCFFDTVVTSDQSPDPTSFFRPGPGPAPFEDAITRVIHVPGLRGNPRRNYPVTAVEDRFSGTFEKYVASVVATAQTNQNQVFLEQLGSDLRELGLTWQVRAKSVDDTQVELQVGRLRQSAAGASDDLVSIADVGFGVSQTLPVVVALLTAKPGQLVYIEQPEIHLHPRAQVAMASLLGRAANRGVRVVIETHSSLLLLGVQRLVADGELEPAKVMLHWFKRDETTGITDITSAELDPAGAFGDWPEDFDDVTLDAQKQYLDAAEKKLAHEP